MSKLLFLFWYLFFILKYERVGMRDFWGFFKLKILLFGKFRLLGRIKIMNEKFGVLLEYG